MSIPRYEAYKPTGVGSLPEVPLRWEATRLRFAAKFNPSKSAVSHLAPSVSVTFLPMEAIGEDGTIELGTERMISDVKEGYSYFRDGDVAFAKITPCFENGKGALMRGLANGIGFGTTELIVARPNAGMAAPEFLFYIFASAWFRNLGESRMYGAGGQKRIPEEFARDFVAALPGTDEQAVIAAFLDRETAKIDELVEEQRRLIALLDEKRQAVISHAVTKGLNPDAPMKASGLDWLGAVPDHWRATRLRVLFRQAKRQDQSDLPVLSVYRDFGVIRKDSRDDNYNKTPEDLSKYQLVNPGDLVVNKMKAWQGSLGISPHEGITSPDYLVFLPTHRENDSYLHWLLRSSVLVSVYRGISNGIRLAQWRLEPDPFLDLRICIPALEEQMEIAAFVDRQEKQSGALIEEAERAIALLLERRAALITAAVTGQIDVRALAPTEAP